ncbi:MAG: CHAT domain-containing protein [Muribaculaceae bacterium]|nr:CHAT domain-containing protein [Muribaculaceae bacterium]
MKLTGRIVIALAMLVSGGSVRAASTAELDSLISEGNRAYLLGQQLRIDEVVGEGYMMLRELWSLDDDEYMSYGASLRKLEGNMNYLEGCATGNADQLELAERLYMDAKEMDAQRFSTGALIDLELAQLYYKQKRYDDALGCINAVLEYYDTTGIYEPGDTEWNSVLLQRAIINARLGNDEEARREAEEALSTFKDKKSLDYGRGRRMYAKILGLTGVDRREALKAYKEYFALQKADALERFAGMNSKGREEYWMMLRPFVADAYALEDADPEFLYDLTLFAKGLLMQLDAATDSEGRPTRRNLEELSLTWKDIRKKLKPGEAAVEFVQYTPFGSEEQAMGALLLLPGKKPVWVQQPSPTLLEKRFGPLIDDGLRKTKDRVYSDPKLPGMVWSPTLMDALNGAKTIFFAPDGRYHTLAVEYLLPGDGPEARRLTSTRRLMDRGRADRSLKAEDAMLLYGDIDYDYTPTPEECAYNDYDAYLAFNYYKFPILSAETDESRAIARLRDNPSDARMRGIFATEGSFRRLAGNFPSILISTHGVSLSANKHGDYSTDLKPAVCDDALSSTVISFTGVNPCMDEYGSIARTHYDGLVSARELSGLDLSRCKLFTMSACQTGLGEVGADGVYGLQRGLKNAGAGAMLVSLWSVQSDATARLMTAFYRRMNEGESMRAAFRGAREDLKSGAYSVEAHNISTPAGTYFFNPATMAGEVMTMDEIPDYDFPQYTDAFILIDAID